MPFKVNGTDFTQQPESDGWSPRQILGIDGNGHPVYPPTREFTLKWGIMAPVDFNQVNSFYLLCGVTGSVVVDLPMWVTGTYSFLSYTGCQLQEPTTAEFFNGYWTGVQMKVTNIRT